MHIKIQWTDDTYDCETCGLNVSYGCSIFFDGQQVFELEPVAYCLGGTSITETEAYQKVIELLGHTVEDTY